MKQMTNAILPVRFTGVNLDEVLRIRFKFTQSGKSLLFDYPSERAERLDTGTIGLHWTVEETAMFNAANGVAYDTMVYLGESGQVIETEPGSFKMTPTLFKKEEVET